MNSDIENSILILGGGLIGLSIAYEFARNNYKVQIISRNRSEAAGFVAAGMLAPHAEGLEDDLLDFGQASQSLIPEWIKNIENDSGINCGLKKCGILLPFKSIKNLKKFPTYQYGQYLNQDDLNREIHGLNKNWKHGLLFEQDGQIDNRRRLMRALEIACTVNNVKFQEGSEIKEIISEKNQFIGVNILNATGETQSIFCKKAIVCCGAWSKQVVKELPIDPVKGQMLSIQGPINKLNKILFGPKTYLVPREDGLIVVGATVEKNANFNKGNTPQGIKELQIGINSLFPEAILWPQMEHWWGFRPSTPDLKPIIGESKIKNLFIATGHYRNGVLFSAITSNIMYKFVQNKRLKKSEQKFVNNFSLKRFSEIY